MLRFFTSGESHGPCLIAILEGIPAGLPLTEADIDADLARRQGGYGRSGRQQIEHDRAEILGGTADGLTTGAPVSLRIENRDWANWKERKLPTLTVPRPGHADWAGGIKYGHRDLRLVLERASARETAARVAVGGIARKLLSEMGAQVHGQVVQIGSVRARPADSLTADAVARIKASPLRCADPEVEEAMLALIEDARAKGETIGGIVQVTATGIPPGLGSYVHWDRRIDGRIAQAVMSVQAIKGVELGSGFGAAELPGTKAHDAFRIVDGAISRPTNHAGGVEGGVTNGQPIVVRAAMKPIPTTITPQRSVDLATGEEKPARYQRSDVCAVPAAAVVAEAMVAFVLADAWVEKFGGDSLRDLKASLESYLAASQYWLRPRP